MVTNCIMTEPQVREAFLAAPPLISKKIIDLTYQHPSFLRDIYELEEWPRGNGKLMEQIVFRGMFPKIERGFDAWKKQANNTGCDPCGGPDCSYNWTKLGGYGFERKITELMSRDFDSDSYCIKEIQTTANYKEVFAKLVENLYNQIDFFKEINIGQNILTSLAKKYVVDGTGPNPNRANPYVYRALGNATISALNINILEFFYEHMRRLPDCIPYDVVDGSPVFSLMASHQLLSRLYRDDANLRQDARFSSSADGLLNKYNFMSTIRGMFLAAPILYPRRFTPSLNIALANELEEVLPFVNDIPMEVGAFSGLNPAYEAAPYEEVILCGKGPFKVLYMPTEETLGENSSFGPEVSWFNTWQWVNPQTVEDPMRRVGKYVTSCSMGISAQYSEGIFGIVVARPSIHQMAVYNPADTCPPTPVDCANTIPAAGCVCPMVVGYTLNPINGYYLFQLAYPVTGTPRESVVFGLDNGGTITGTLQSISSSGLYIEVSFAAGVTIPDCNRIISIACAPTLACSSEVLAFSDCRSGETSYVTVILKTPIKADTAADVVTAIMGDGTTQSLSVVSVDMATNTWRLAYAAGYGPTDDPDGSESGVNHEADMGCDRHGIVYICVPPSTDPTCPACAVSSTLCEEEEQQ